MKERSTGANWFILNIPANREPGPGHPPKNDKKNRQLIRFGLGQWATPPIIPIEEGRYHVSCGVRKTSAPYRKITQVEWPEVVVADGLTIRWSKVSQVTEVLGLVTVTGSSDRPKGCLTFSRT